jgi:hypothetical protein
MSASALIRIRYLLALGMLAALLAPFAAQAQSLDITYYTIASDDPDANHLAFGTFTNEVENSLGPNGLPVLNLSQYGCSTDCFSSSQAPGFPSGGTVPNANVDAATGEILYWSPTMNSSYVTETLATTTTLPFNEPSNFFPPNGTGISGDGGSAGYQAAMLSGTINAPTAETLSFNIGSDDMAFAYIDGNLVCSDGGVHGSSSVPCTTPSVGAGNHTFDLFFVDINQSQSGLTFQINTQGVTTAPPAGGPAGAPEIDAASAPAALVLLFGILAVVRGRRPVQRFAA